jgi:hypothetical protein
LERLRDGLGVGQGLVVRAGYGDCRRGFTACMMRGHGLFSKPAVFPSLALGASTSEHICFAQDAMRVSCMVHHSASGPGQRSAMMLGC